MLRRSSQDGLAGQRQGSDLPEARSPEEIFAGAVPMGGVGVGSASPRTTETPTSTQSIKDRLAEINAERDRLARERQQKEARKRKRSTTRRTEPVQGPAWLLDRPVVRDQSNGLADGDSRQRGARLRTSDVNKQGGSRQKRKKKK